MIFYALISVESMRHKMSVLRSSDRFFYSNRMRRSFP